MIKQKNKFEFFFRYLRMTKRIFVTGAPRSGTTYLSDWITVAPSCYCVHEVIQEHGDSEAYDLDKKLFEYARTTADRIGKYRHRDFMRWDTIVGKDRPAILGLKEPWRWLRENELTATPRITKAQHSLPGPASLWRWISHYNVSVLVLKRHPLDIVASGKRRAVNKSAWPSYITRDICEFWLTSACIARYLQREAHNVMILTWERIALEPEPTRASLNAWLGATLPIFDGYERDPAYLADLRSRITLSKGVEGSRDRALLSDEDRQIVAETLVHPLAWNGYTV